ncbi:hypothetical protein [Metabacillus sp. RGM 3146]|uniref:hypothetical protein n=1 Tax=Metabacillus sp. RGM 3146 TaxID=3401092 RepID=UPI003B99DD87
MIIEESFTEAKTGMKEDNEDSFVITDSYIAVIDGMTPKDRTLYNGESPAQIAAGLIKEDLLISKVSYIQGSSCNVNELSKVLLHSKRNIRRGDRISA